MSNPQLLRNFPWATFGRAEMPTEFFQKIAEQSARAELFFPTPVFALIAVVESTEGLRQAGRTWESLLLQSYPHWQVWVAAPEGAALALPDDPRFHRVRVPEGTPGWKAKNAALEEIAGGLVGVVAVGDVLSPAALYQLAVENERAPKAGGFYTHEVGLRGKKLGDFFSKRAWSPWTQAHWNFVGRFWVLRREHLTAFEPLPAGSDEQVALLRAGLIAPLVGVPHYLYYGRNSARFVEPDEPLHHAIDAVLNESGPNYRTERDTSVSPARLKITPLRDALAVTAIICFRDRAEMTLRALRGLVANRGDVALDVVLVDNDSSPEELAKITPFLSELPVKTRLVHFPGTFHYNRMHNWAVKEHARGDLLLFLNNDVEFEKFDLNHWASWASEPGIATTGIQLRFDHGGVQHAGIRAWFGGGARVARIGNSHARDALTGETREVYANTFAACLIQRAAFEAVGGLREKELANGFGDVAFCFEAVQRGWHHLYLGSVEGVHRESTSRGKMPYEYWEELGVEREYPAILQRMLREDIGLNRVPQAEYAVGAFLLEALKAWFRRHSSWLNPVKPALKKGLMRAIPAGDSP